MHRARRWLAGSAMLGLYCLAGCGSPPAPVPPTAVNVILQVAPDANAGADGKGAPVALRLYQLSSRAGFDASEFFPVFNTDKAVLKEDVVKRDDYLLAPGQSKMVALMPADQTIAIGLFAGYRDYEHTAWRATVDVPAHAASDLTVTVGKAGLAAKIGPAQPAK